MKVDKLRDVWRPLNWEVKKQRKEKQKVRHGKENCLLFKHKYVPGTMLGAQDPMLE